MNEFASLFFPTLLRTTLWLTAAGLITLVTLRIARVTSPTIHRALCVLTLLLGWTFLRFSVAVPWLDQPLASRDAIPSNLHAAIPTEPAVSPIANENLLPEPSSPLPDLKDAAIAPTSPLEKPKVEPAVSHINWPLTALAVWMLGIGLLVLASIAGYLRFLRRLRMRTVAPPDWIDQWQQLLQAQGVQRAIPLFATEDLGPMICRLPRGYELIVPASLWSELDESQRAAILRHELAHYQRADVWKSLAVRLLALPHWFNPVTWWAVRRFDEAAEWACDQAAITDEPPVNYAKTLLRLGEAVDRQASYCPAARGRTLAHRIRRLLSPQRKEDSVMKSTLLIAAAACLVVVAFTRLELVAKEPIEPTVVADEKLKDAVEPVADELQKPTAGMSLVEAAQKAYLSSCAAYEADTVPIEKVFTWSQRLLDAELLVAENREQRLAALRGYVDRTDSVAKKVKALYEEGAKGGEMENHWPAQFHHEDAQRRLAEEQRQAAAAPGPRSQQTNQGNQQRPIRQVPDKVALSYDGKGFDAWRRMLLMELKPETRVEAIQALRAFGARGYGREATTAIVSVMGEYRHPNPSNAEGLVPITAMEALKAIPKTEVMPVLLESLKSKDDNQRFFAVAMCGQLGSAAKEAVPLLLEMITKDKDTEIRRMAMNAVNSTDRNAEGFVPALRAALHDDDIEIVLAAIGVLVPDNQPVGRERVSTDANFVPELVELLEHKNEAVRSAAYYAMRRLGPKAKPGLPVALRRLESDDAQVRRAGLELITMIGPAATEAMPAVMNLLGKTEDRNEVQSAGNCLFAIADKPIVAVHALIDALAEKNDLRLRTNAAVALNGPRVPPAKEVISALEQAALSDDKSLNTAAKQALKNILHNAKNTTTRPPSLGIE